MKDLQKVFENIDIAIKAEPSPPHYIPNNVCSSECHVCCRRWFENTITMFRCQCRDLRLCPTCAGDMKELESMEHNLIDCNYVSNSDSEDDN